MCGRIAAPKDLSRIAERYGVMQNINFPQNFNLAPTEECPIMAIAPEGKKKLRLARFGLIPGWAKEAKVSHSMINARAETITDKTFKSAFEKRRCIIPVEGFYEWRKEGDIKQPYKVTDPNGGLLSLAGIWEFNNKIGEDIYSFAIITTDANETMQPYHNRMPVIIEDIDQWLSEGGKQMLKPAIIPLNVQKIDPSMNNPRQKSVINSA